MTIACIGLPGTNLNAARKALEVLGYTVYDQYHFDELLARSDDKVDALVRLKNEGTVLIGSPVCFMRRDILNKGSNMNSFFFNTLLVYTLTCYLWFIFPLITRSNWIYCLVCRSTNNRADPTTKFILTIENSDKCVDHVIDDVVAQSTRFGCKFLDNVLIWLINGGLFGRTYRDYVRFEDALIAMTLHPLLSRRPDFQCARSVFCRC